MDAAAAASAAAALRGAVELLSLSDIASVVSASKLKGMSDAELEAVWRGRAGGGGKKNGNACGALGQ